MTTLDNPNRRPIAQLPLWIWLTFITTFLSPIGALPVLLACGEELTTADAGANLMTLKDVTQGSLLFKTNESGRFLPAPLLKTDVKIMITGTIARATLTQEFINPSREPEDWAEGMYVFPLPETAAVDHLTMTVGDRTIVGEIKERAEAKKAYEQAKQKGKRAGLVEQERPNVFTASVANITPGDRIIVEIQYQESVRYDQGTYSLRFPMVVGPRYIPGTPVVMIDQPPGIGWSPDTDRVPDASRITPPVQHHAQSYFNPITLTVDLTAGFPLSTIESPSHDILTIAASDGQRQITLRRDQLPANKDFVLTWKAAARQPTPTATVYTEQQGGNSYAYLMVSPPTSGQSANPIPRETIFVIDTSGSMAGTSIEQARAAVQLALTKLTAQDRFNVIEFNSVTHVLFSQPQPVKSETLRRAVQYVDRLKANGGTEILPALKTALKDAAPSSHFRQIIFLTDGQVGNEDELFDVIRSQLGRSRLFTIGIGSAPNSHFMRKAAEFGRGTFTHIGSTSEVKAQMDAIFHKLERPVLTDLAVEGLDGMAEMFPSKIPDLYEGEPIVVAIKAATLPSGVTIKGKSGAGDLATTVDLSRQPTREGLSVFWARRKIDSLMDQHRYGQEETALRQAVLDVALPHHLISKYTSLVAVDHEPVRPSNKQLVTHAMRTNVPEGQDYQAIFGLPKTATSGRLRIWIGLVAMTLATFLLSARRALA